MNPIAHLPHYAPFVLATAAALVQALAVLPYIKRDVRLSRWYQPALMVFLALLGVVVATTVIWSSPWVGLGAILLAVLVASAAAMALRSRGAGDEPLAFLQALINVMSANLDLLQALQKAARDPEFERPFPHLAAECREIVSRVEAGERLSAAVARVAPTTPRDHRQIWTQIGVLAEMIEERHLPLEGQRQTLSSYWEVALDVYDINRGMKQEMAQMEAAKFLFLLIVPGVNLYMWRALDTYAAFATSTLGIVVLIMEAMALALVFIVMSLLQKFPEVQV